MVHNLHKDIFYCPDPSLAFVGVSHHIPTFSLLDFQARVVARVFADKALLPPRGELRKLYLRRLEEREPGRDFHSLRGEGQELAYVADLVAWMNNDAIRLGVSLMIGHTDEFMISHRVQRERL